MFPTNTAQMPVGRVSEPEDQAWYNEDQDCADAEID